MRYIELRYKCRCLAQEVSVQMRERGKAEDIADYMRAVQSELAIDHARRSPLCVSRTVKHVKLPLAPGRPIGEAEGGNA